MERTAAKLGRIWRALKQPEMPEERRAAAGMWSELPEHLRTEDQVLGRHSAGCAATYGVMEACNFNCTACYLSDDANHTPPLPLDEVKAQLDAIREHLGPWGNTQITAGEVTMLPCDDLVEIFRYCQKIELSPMLMTNGQILLEDPNYLERLVLEGGLDKVGIHIDTTQKGRRGLKNRDTEKDIHWMRDAFANLLRQTRRRTGRPLSASHTFTVTESNFDGVPDVMRWLTRNGDAFRMVSFQPTADVGRTRSTQQTGRRGALWAKINEGLGTTINPQPFKFGHPDCNSVSLSFVAWFRNEEGEDEHHVMDVVRPDNPEDEAFFNRLLNDGFAGFSPDGEPGSVVLARIFGRIAKNPRFLFDIPNFSLKRVSGERAWLPRLAKAIAAGRPWSVKPLVVVVHDFMSADELDTPKGQERLQSCSFRVPVDGRMVSMCELNGTDLRTRLNLEDQDRVVSRLPIIGPRATPRAS